MKTHTKFALALCVFSLSAGLALADRPEAGQGGVFVDEMDGLNFQWVDFDGDSGIFAPYGGGFTAEEGN